MDSSQQENRPPENEGQQKHPIVKQEFSVVTLCGSTKFRTEFEKAMKDLTLAGYCVLSVGCFGHSDGMDRERIFHNKEMLDRMHLQKIDMADWIFVVNPGGYIGESTRKEIDYALSKGKHIEYMDH